VSSVLVGPHTCTSRARRMLSWHTQAG
jgi:hypothetical protein